MALPKLLKHLKDLGALSAGDLLKYDGEKLVKAVDGTDFITATSGTTNGWNWVKYSDGRAECSIETSKACSVTNVWGTLYESAGFIPPAFPFTFAAPPSCTFIPLDNCLIEVSGSVSATGPGAIVILRPDKVDSDARAWKYGIRAYGRWK